MTWSRASTPAGRSRVAARTGRTAAKPAQRKPAATRSPKRATASRPKQAKRTPAPKRAQRRAPARAKRPAAPRRPRTLAAAGPSLAERLPSLPRLSLPRVPALRLPRPSLAGARALPRRRTLLLILLALAGLLVFYFGWFRDSSLVAVRHVTVQGVTTDDDQVTAALTDAAKGMSTLDVDRGKLEGAVASFPTVAGISVDPNFPSGMTITVNERPPALIASDGRSETPVAADGTILGGVELSKDRAAALPVLQVQQARSSGHLEGSPLSKALVIGAAPKPLRPLIEGEKIEPDLGVVVTMKGGFRIEFGSSEMASRKWAAAAAVLADPKLHSLTYVDVRIPRRPAVGGS